MEWLNLILLVVVGGMASAALRGLRETIETTGLFGRLHPVRVRADGFSRRWR